MRATAREVVGAYAAVQSSVVRGSYDLVLEDAPDAIHAARVACRRLRSTLRTYGPLWLGGRGAVRRQLAWYARLLGTSRDLEVVSAWLAELRSDPLLAEVPASDLEDLYEHALSRRTTALSTLRQELHREPFDTLAALLPPANWSPLSELPADEVLPPMAAAQVLLVRAEAEALPTGVHRTEALHEVRKTAKLVRYAYEVLGPAATADASHWKRVTEALGVTQDAAVATCVVSDLRELKPESVQTWDAVDAVLTARAQAAEATGLALIGHRTGTPA